VRADSGFFDAKVAHAAVAHGCDFVIVAKRSSAVWSAARAVPDDAWRQAVGMTGAEVAFCGYVPAGWPPGTRCVVRRMHVDAEEISGDARSRRRRTIDPDQLALALDGHTGHAYAYSFICTNLTLAPVAFEYWFRQRALVGCPARRRDGAGTCCCNRRCRSGSSAVHQTRRRRQRRIEHDG